MAIIQIYIAPIFHESVGGMAHLSSDDDDWFLTDEGFGKVDGQLLPARWSLKRPILDAQALLHFGQAKSGLRMTDMLLILSSATFLCGSIPLCFELTTGFSHWWAPTVSVWGLLLPWLRADSRPTHSLAIWCQGWSASSVNKTAQVAWSASGTEPRVAAAGGYASRDLLYSSFSLQFQKVSLTPVSACRVRA